MAGHKPRRHSASRDEALVAMLHTEHGKAVLAYATKLTGDLLVNGWGSVRAWMFTVAHNLVMDPFRARAVRPTEVAEHPAAEPLADDHADRVTDLQTVLDALHALSEEHRSVLFELYFRGRSVHEAATTLGVPPGTVKSRTYYALRALRRFFDTRPAARPVPV